jgi:cytochrome b
MTNRTTPPLARAQPPQATATRPAGRLVTDAPVRAFHALFALCFAGAWLTGDSERWRLLHETLGYTMGGLLAFRLAYGLVGPRPARIGALLRRTQGLWTWLAALHRPGRAGLDGRTGQNLALGVTVVLMMAAVPLVVASGHALSVDWGGDVMEEVHEALVHLLLGLVLVHLGLLALVSALRGRNLALPMLTGRVAGPGPDLVRRPRRGLALLLVLAVIAFGAWQWQSAPQDLLPSRSAASAQLAADDD